MENSSDSRQLINNELLARAANTRAKRVIKSHTPTKEQANLQISFYCECSDNNCRERISLSLEDYENLHAKNSHFIIARGHQTPLVEKVHKTKRDLIVVEKYALKD